MRIIRVRQGTTSFYARLEDDMVYCLDRTKGIDAPLPLSSVTLLPLAIPGKIVCVAMNYESHAEELGKKLPDEPLIFLKPPTALSGHGLPIVLPSMSEQVDYEGELAIVMGQVCRHCEPEDALQHIFGYTCANDVTARDLQRKDGIYTRSKGFDTFAPVGPWIETNVPDTSNLQIQTTVNEEVRQEASTSEMHFTPDQIISHISKVMTLMPGDIIMTGTPGGIGQIHPGDQVSVEIEGVGLLTNPVVDAATEAAHKENPDRIQ